MHIHTHKSPPTLSTTQTYTCTAGSIQQSIETNDANFTSLEHLETL